jgi:hypothetical protein
MVNLEVHRSTWGLKKTLGEVASSEGTLEFWEKGSMQVISEPLPLVKMLPLFLCHCCVPKVSPKVHILVSNLQDVVLGDGDFGVIEL